MKTIKFLQLTLILLIGVSLTAQQSYTYNFDGNFTESSGNGPTLQAICTGQFETETLPDYNLSRQIYHFDENCGFTFDDSGGFIASGNYTIELYFKMKDLSVWRRVTDFKDRTSDYGCYVFNGEMNFYNIVTSTTAPFRADSFAHYAITRNNTTKKVVLYGDGNVLIDFIDNNEDAVYDGSNKKLHFFQDDLVVGGEASEGSIAVLKISNYAKDSVAVKTSYNNLSGTLTGIKEAEVLQSINIYPNPANNFVSITNLPVNSIIRLTDVSGKLIYTSKVADEQTVIGTENFGSGVYFIAIENNGSIANRKLVINQ